MRNLEVDRLTGTVKGNMTELESRRINTFWLGDTNYRVGTLRDWPDGSIRFYAREIERENTTCLECS